MVAVPLHIPPDDHSPEACRARLELHGAMAQLNPKGWRTPRRRVPVTKMYRLDRLAALAPLAGKAAIAESVIKAGARE